MFLLNISRNSDGIERIIGKCQVQSGILGSQDNSLDIGSDVEWTGPEEGRHSFVHDAVVLDEAKA